MTIAARRAFIASRVDAVLPEVRMFPYRPKAIRGMSGWLELNQVDTEDVSFGELRLQFDIVILLATDQEHFEKYVDVVAEPLLSVLADIGRGVTLRSATDPGTGGQTFCLVATITTESEAA